MYADTAFPGLVGMFFLRYAGRRPKCLRMTRRLFVYESQPASVIATVMLSNRGYNR